MSWDESTSVGWTPQPIETYIDGYYVSFKANGYPELSYSQFAESREFENAYMCSQIDSSISTSFGEMIQRITVFIRDTNQDISNPTTTPNSIIKGINDNFGYKCSVKEMTEEDSGKMHLAIDYVSTPEEDLLIGQYLEKNSIVASTYMVGDIEQIIVLSEGGIETYRWTAQNEINTLWRTIITLSRNSTAAIDPPETVQKKFYDNWEIFYWIGMDVEPERYLEINRDCPYASNVKTEYSLDDGVTWLDAVINSNYNDKYIPDLKIENIEFV
ncbi:hypothetical protein [Aliivibrio fischeri]|uniref:Uncharacterized protein n=1 Tax=Aliivibrio fischeri SR5 TaxID=1088719 RepID=A0AAV3EVP6_ALIFS|nr:hypothetical protein [Aliivibrio fischeri]EHN70915.1 hypothetical protein VFSR5_0695 [Aliivibrio fischeri SR5]